MKKVVIVSAHPDDEALGAGGTLLKYKKQGYLIYWIIATHVFESQGYSRSIIEKREAEIEKVKKAFGIQVVYNLKIPTTTLDSSNLNTYVGLISTIFKEVQPQIILLPNRSDAHSDHRILFDAVMACTKSFRYPTIEQVMMYECLSETEFAPALIENVFLPNYFVDISSFMDQKIEVLKIYSSELGDHPFPRSIENVKAIATYRGASVGVHFAEAFQLLKFIEK
jgi:LmbE family N-acetylglucosaminyl deacetylase